MILYLNIVQYMQMYMYIMINNSIEQQHSQPTTLIINNNSTNNNNTIIQQYQTYNQPSILSHIYQQHSIGDIFTATLTHRTQRLLYYNCCFRWTQQQVQLVFVDMRHIYLYVQRCKQMNFNVTHIQPIKVRKGQSIAFWQYHNQHSNNIHANNNNQEAASSNNNNNSNNNNINTQNNFSDFLLHLCLIRLQQNSNSQINVQHRQQYLHADGVLYNNCIAYTKSTQYILTAQQVTQLTHLDHMKLRNQLLNMHARHLGYTLKQESQYIAYILDRYQSSTININKSVVSQQQSVSTTKSQHTLAPILTITRTNIKYYIDYDKYVREVDAQCNQQVQQLQHILNNSQITNNNNRYSKSCSSQVKSIDMSNSSDNNHKHSINQLIINNPNKIRDIKRQASINKLLFIPRLYALIDKCQNVQIFQQEALKLQNERYGQLYNMHDWSAREQEINWYVDKYHQQHNEVNTTKIQLNNKPQLSHNLSINTKIQQNYDSNRKTNKMNNINQYEQSSISIEMQSLIKQYNNVLDGHYISTIHQNSELKLGWGELQILYHYNSTCSNAEAYVDSLKKYITQLSMHLQFRRVRKIYHVYCARLMAVQHQYHYSIWHLQQAHYYINNKDHTAMMLDKAVLSHQLGRIYYYIKKYKQSLQYFRHSIQLKQIIYGKCSLSILNSLYNILFILLNCHSSSSLSQQQQQHEQQLQQAIRQLSLIKHNTNSQECILEWANLQHTRQAMPMIMDIQKMLQYQYQDPWKDIMGKIVTSKVVHHQQNIIKKNTHTDIRNSEQQPQIMHQVSFYGQQHFVSQCYNKWLKYCQSSYSQKQSNNINKLLLRISEINLSSFQTCNRIKLQVLKHYLKLCSSMPTVDNYQLTHVNQFMQNLQQIIVCLNQDKYNLNKKDPINTINSMSREKQCKQLIIIDIKQIIYQYYKQMRINALNQQVNKQQNNNLALNCQSNNKQAIYQRWQKWLYTDYYESDRPNMCSIICKMSIYNILQYCLLAIKYRQDYAHIYNILSHAHAQITQSPRSLQLIWNYLLSVSLIHMGKYTQLIALLQPLLSKISTTEQQHNNSQTQTNSQIYLLYKWLPKGTIYLYQLQYMLLLAYFHTRQYAQFLHLCCTVYTNTLPICQNNSQLFKQYEQLSMLILKVYNKYHTIMENKEQGNNNSNNVAGLHQLVNSVVNNLRQLNMPNSILLKIMHNYPLSSILQYIQRVYDNMYISPSQQQQKQASDNLLQILTSAVDQNSQHIQWQLFYQTSISMLVKLLDKIEVQKYRIFNLLYQVIDKLFTQHQHQQKQKTLNIIINDQIASQVVQFMQINIQAVIQQKCNPQFSKQKQQKSLNAQQILKILQEWIPLLIRKVVKPTPKQQIIACNNNNMYKIGHKNKNTKIDRRIPQIVIRIVRAVTPWFRYKQMIHQTIMSEIFLHSYSSTMHKIQASAVNNVNNNYVFQKMCNQQIQTLNTLFFSQNDAQANQETFIIPNWTTLIELGLDQYFEPIQLQLSKIITQLHQLIKQQRQCIAATQNTIEDKDDKISNIQNIDHKLENIKASLQILLPGCYAKGLLAKIQQIQASLHIN